KYIPALKTIGCGLTFIAAGIEVAVNEVTGNEIHGDAVVALVASIATSCAFAALPMGLQTGWGYILLPVFAALIAYTVDVYQQLWFSLQPGNHPAFSFQHSIYTGLAAGGTGAAGALISAKTEVMRGLLEGAVASGGASGIADKLNQGGACS